ncbi:MAG: calcineurin-like phosphoesterase family protein [Bacteroidales bacterium]|nr:calcineurin-like phosphoesterase family protein [Bacteroidales bacterium]
MKKFLISVALAAWCLAASAVDPLKDVCGQVLDTDGKPLAGVVVSDGYTAVQTDAEGRYAFVRNAAAAYVFVSVPADCVVPLRQGHPCFYRKLDDKRTSYDFELRRLKKVETDFNLFLLGDPQCQNTHHVDRMKNEGIADMKAYAKKQKGSCYAVTLGDIGYSEGGRNTNYLFPVIRQEMAADKAGMPIFQTPGNHDFEFASGSVNEFSPTVTLRRNRMFEAVFGPLDYSWNRGDVHIVSMNDVRFDNLEKASKYSCGFSDEQLEWLRQDLSFVPKDKMVILCVHIPFATKSLAGMKSEETKHAFQNVLDAVELMGQFSNAMVFSGHTHTNFKNTLFNGVREFTVGAMSGCWWWSRNCADGSPNGYLVCHFKGNRLADHIYKGLGFSDKHQMRIYRGDAVFGGKFEEFRLQHGHDALLINVYNYDESWKVQVYENGKLMADDLKPMAPSKEFEPTADGGKDWWAIGYNVGVVGRGHSPGSTRNNYCEKCWHMFEYKMTDPNAKVKVVVIDDAGRKFTETKIYDSKSLEEVDYSLAEPPAYHESQIW